MVAARSGVAMMPGSVPASVAMAASSAVIEGPMLSQVQLPPFVAAIVESVTLFRLSNSARQAVHAEVLAEAAAAVPLLGAAPRDELAALEQATGVG